MWGRLAAAPAGGSLPERRRRSSKFDSPHRHRHAKTTRDPDTDASVISGQGGPPGSAGTVTLDLSGVEPGALDEAPFDGDGLLQPRQVTVEVAVTVSSTAIVSIDVNENGDPIATTTTTLPLDSTPEASPNTPTESYAAPPETTSTADVPNPDPTVTAAGVESSNLTTSTQDAADATPTTLNAESATTPIAPVPGASTSVPIPVTSAPFVSDSATTAAAPATTDGTATTSDSSYIFASLIATNGTTTAGLSLTSSNTDSLTAAAASSTTVSLTSGEIFSTNGTIAVVRTKSQFSTSSSRSSNLSSSVYTASSNRHSSTISSQRSSSTAISTTSSNGALAGFGGATATGAGAPGATNEAGGNGSTSDGQDAVAPPATIAGTVVGSVAGVALIVAILFFFLRRWHRKRSLMAERSTAARQLGVEDPFGDPPNSGGAMVQRTSRPLLAAGAMGGLLNRMSRHSEPVVPPAERGFQRVSGRKLASAFSPGMEALPAGAAVVSQAHSGPNHAKNKDMGAAGVGDRHHSPTSSDDAANDDWYHGEADSFGGETAVAPGTGSTGMTHFVPGYGAADPSRSRYPSSAYSADGGGIPRSHGSPPTGRTTETLLPSPARTPVIQQPSPFGRSSHVPGFSHVPGSDRGDVSPTFDRRPSPSSLSPGRSSPQTSVSPDRSRGSRFTESIP